jgi:hypothetical protein
MVGIMMTKGQTLVDLALTAFRTMGVNAAPELQLAKLWLYLLLPYVPKSVSPLHIRGFLNCLGVISTCFRGNMGLFQSSSSNVTGLVHSIQQRHGCSRTRLFSEYLSRPLTSSRFLIYP